MFFVLLLSACGGGDGSSNAGRVEVAPSAAIAPVPTPTPTPTPSPTPVATAPAPAEPSGTQSPAAAATTVVNPFTNYDFARGNSYPAMPSIRIEPATYRPGATVAHVPVTLSGPAPTTVIAYVSTTNGETGKRGLSGTNYRKTVTPVIFRPGDPLVKTVSVPLLKTTEGMVFNLIFVTTAQGANRTNSKATVTASAAATPTPEQTSGFRAPRVFAPSAPLKYELTAATLQAADKGGSRVLSTKLSHGRTQPANGETGVYLDAALFSGIEAPLRTEGGNIVLHSQQLSTPITIDGVAHPHGASVLSGHATPEAQIGYGQYEWDVKMPNRSGAWPALWLISTAGWPPEIDVYEGFGQKSSWLFDEEVSHSFHGGASVSRAYMRYNEYNAKKIYGVSGFSTEFHKFAVDIQPDYVTWFIDGREVFQAVNGFRDKRWYPIMNVAVKKAGAYSGGSGDMTIRSMKVYGN